ncbi:hypothetical protein IX51_00055 [uncultured archaeon]|nr:hypothetical protein IX51_00055 [uncultured archaeon]
MTGETGTQKLQGGFRFQEEPAHICERVQKFRSRLTIAIRCADLNHQGVGIKPEDSIMHAAISCFDGTSGKPLHTCLISALR